MSSTANSTFTGTFIDQTAQVLRGAQTEIVIFLVAFCFHALFFGRLRVNRKVAPRGDAKQVHTKGSGPSNGTNMPKPSTRSAHAKELARCSARLCELKDTAQVAAELSEKMQMVSNEDTVDALVGLMEGAGRSGTLELLASVRELLHHRGLIPNMELGELLLRSYLGLRIMNDFDELFRELEAAHGSVPALAMLALKGALRRSDLKASLDHIGCLLSIDGGGLCLQQVVRLAAEQQSIPQLLSRLQELDMVSHGLDAVLVECTQSGNAADVEAVMGLARKQGLQFGESAYCALIKGATVPKEALSLFTEAVELRTPTNCILKVASEWALHNGDVPLAKAVLQTLPPNPQADTVGNLLRFHCKDQTDQDADAIVLRMYVDNFKSVDFSADRGTAHLVAMAAIRHAESHSGAPTGGAVLQGLLTSMPDSGRVTLLKTLGAEKHLEGVLAVLRMSPAQGTCLYNAAIDACIECGSIEDAQKLMAGAVKSGVADTITYNTLVKAFLQAKRPREAREAMEAMKAAGLRPNCVTFNELLDGVVKSGIESAWSVLDEMRASGTRPNRVTCAILLKAVQPRTRPADVERAVAVLDEMEEDLDEVLLCSVVDACIRGGRSDLLIPQLKKHRASGKNMSKGPHTYGSIIRAFGFVHDLNAVWETWREVCTRHIPANAVTLGCMVEALCSNGEVEAGYELINEMLKDEQWSPLVNAVIYCSVLKGFSHQKRFDRLWTVYKEMLGHNLQFSIVTFNTLVDACSRNSEMSRIPALLKDMIAQGIQPNLITYSAVLKGYCQENRIEEAFSVVEGMVQTTSLRPDEIMFNTLLDGCARQGLYSRGTGVLEDMQKANVAPTNYTLSVLVKLASRSKKLDKAFEFCEEIPTKYKFRLNVHVYSNLVNACIMSKDLGRAFGVFEKMLTERVRPETRTYTLLIRACVANGEADDAAGLLRAAVGLSGVHRSLSKYDSRLLQPQGGLASALITEVIEGIAGQCRSERLAVELLRDLRTNSRVKLDPKLQLRLATAALNS